MPELADREKWERRIAREIAPWLSQQELELLALMGPEFLLDEVPPEFWQEQERSLLPGLALVFAGLFAAAVEQMPQENSLFIPIDTQRVTSNATEWASQHAAELVTNITQTTREQLNSKVTQAIANEWNVEQLREALTPQFGPTRAALIATTETTTAAVEGEIAAVAELERATQIQVQAVWETRPELSATGPCPICAPLNETIQGEAWFDPPPAHPRCVCTLRYEERA